MVHEAAKQQQQKWEENHQYFLINILEYAAEFTIRPQAVFGSYLLGVYYYCRAQLIETVFNDQGSSVALDIRKVFI